jgi:dTDP-4-dehydrorhamnose reductase
MGHRMKLLVAGSKGQLGWELCRRAQHHDFDVTALDLPELDITDPIGTEKVLSQKDISMVINAAAYTAVDKAESERDQAFAVNSEGPRYLALACAKSNIPLIHISTDYVFDGTKKTPYTEGDPISPMGVYGESKAAGEKAVRDSLEAHMILRTSWLYSAHGNNFVKTILRLASEREELRVVADQYGCPTYAADLAAAILTIAKWIHDQGPVSWGTYNYCGRGITSWHDFAQNICDIGKKYMRLKVKTIKAIPTSEYPTAANRPPYSALDCAKIEESFGITRKLWQDSLAEMLSKDFSH